MKSPLDFKMFRKKVAVVASSFSVVIVSVPLEGSYYKKYIDEHRKQNQPDIPFTRVSARLGFGLAVSKKSISKKAVDRNLVRRRLKSVMRNILYPKIHNNIAKDHIYLIIAKKSCMYRDFEKLTRDVLYCFYRLKQNTKDEVNKNANKDTKP